MAQARPPRAHPPSRYTLYSPRIPAVQCSYWIQLVQRPACTTSGAASRPRRSRSCLAVSQSRPTCLSYKKFGQESFHVDLAARPTMACRPAPSMILGVSVANARSAINVDAHMLGIPPPRQPLGSVCMLSRRCSERSQKLPPSRTRMLQCRCSRLLAPMASPCLDATRLIQAPLPGACSGRRWRSSPACPR